MNTLEQSLAKFLATPEASKKTFYTALLRAEVFCLGYVVDHAHEGSDECEDEHISIMHWEDESGNVFVPFFTSLDAMADLIDEDEQYLCMYGCDFLKMTEGETLLLNPESETEYAFSPEDVKEILALE
jgi:hypothetical protein